MVSHRFLFRKYEHCEEAIKDFRCPLSFALIRDPVLGANDQAYERKYLERYARITGKKNGQWIEILDPLNQIIFCANRDYQFHTAVEYRNRLESHLEALEAKKK